MSERRKSVLITIAVIGIIVGAVMTPVAVIAFRHWLEFNEAFRAYKTALLRADYSTAYRWSSPEFRAATPYPEFVAQQLQMTAAFGPLKAIHLGETEVHGHGKPWFWEAIAHAEFTYQRTTATFICSFRNKNGRWELYGYRRL